MEPDDATDERRDIDHGEIDRWPAPDPSTERSLAELPYHEMMATFEDRLAMQRVSSIEAGRRKAGTLGAAMAGAMVALSEIYESPKKDHGVVTVEASSDPEDLDRDGLDMTVGETDVSAPALERLDPVGEPKRKPPQL